NFAALPLIDRRADMLEPEAIGNELAAGRGYLGFMRNGWQETLGVDMTSGRPDQTIILPNSTFLPLWTAVAVGSFVLCLLFKFYWLSLLPLAIVLALSLAWTRVTGLKHDQGDLDIGGNL